MKLSRYPLALVASLAVTSLALSACGSSDDAGAKTDHAPPKTTAVNIKATDATKLKQGGTVNWATSGFGKQWNSLTADGMTAEVLDVMRALMPSFWHSKADGKQVVNKAFLLDASSRTVKGKQVVTWHLNPKAKWSDGTPITWKDLAADTKALDGHDKNFKVSATTGFDQVQSVKKGKDDYEAVMTFTKPFGDWKGMFSAPANAPLYPAKYVADAKTFNNAYSGKIPVTSNAFQLGKIDKTAQTVTIVPNKAWWGDKPKLDKIVFRGMDGASMPAAFANGELDYFDIGGDASAYKQVSKVASGEIREAGGPNFRHFSLNGKSDKLTDPKVRQAVFKAIDRSTIAKSDLKGLGWKPTTLDNHYLMENQKGFRSNVGTVGKYDPAASKKMLDAAGWTLHGKTRKKDGKPLALRFVIPAGFPQAVTEGSMVTEMLSEVGVKVHVQSVPTNDFFTKYLAKGDFDMTPYSLLGTPFPASGDLNVFGSKGGTNYGRIGSKKLDDVLNQATAATDPAESQRLINKADVLTWQEASILPIYQRPDIGAVKKNLANMGALGLTDPVYEHIGFTK